MNPKKIWCNLGVEDLERTYTFYTSLGFKPNGPHTSKELTSFFFGDDQFVIHFFLKDILERNTKMTMAKTHMANELIFTLSAKSKNEADAWAKEVEKAGGKIISPPEAFGPGYYGFIFADPDGHRFNVFYAEGM